MHCNICEGQMIGDGYTMQRHCENVNLPIDSEPDGETINCMKFKTKPFAHQLEAFEKFKDAKIMALNADMGVGKTKIAIDIAVYKYLIGEVDRVFVIAPSGIHHQWVDEQIPEHCGVEHTSLSYNSKKTLKVLREIDHFFYNLTGKLAFFTVNIESFARPIGLELADRFFKGCDKGMIIVDEASIIKTPDIKTVRNVKKLRDKHPNFVRCTMTGTPAAKGPVNLWSIYDFLKRNYMGCSYVAFKAQHVIMFRQVVRRLKGRFIEANLDLNQEYFDKVKSFIATVRLNKKTLTDYDIANIRKRFGLTMSDYCLIDQMDTFTKYKNIDQLKQKIEPDTFAVNKADCLDLPPKIYRVEKFKLNPKQKELIQNLKKYAVATYQGEALTLDMKALLGLRILQICGGFFSHHTDIEGEYDQLPVAGKNAKLEFLRRELDEIGSQQSIIWAVYTAEIEMLQEELSKQHSIAMVFGETKDDERRKVINKFKRGQIQHLVANPAVVGMGYNLQNAAVQYWYSRNYRTEHRIQAEDRNYRIGTEKSPIIVDLVYDIEIEKVVLETIRNEKAINDFFVNKQAKELFK